MTLSVRFVFNFGHKKLVLFCTFQCANITCPGRTLWHNLTIGALIGSLSYTSKLVLWGCYLYWKFLLHVPCYLYWKVSLTRPMLLVLEGFSYTSRATATCIGRFLLHVPCYLYWKVSLTRFLLHVPCYLHWKVSLTRPVLLVLEGFSYTSRATCIGRFLLHVPCYLYWKVSLTRPVLLALEVSLTRYTSHATCIFSYTSHDLYWRFLLHVTRPMLLVLEGFSYTSHDLYWRFLLHLH